MMKCNVMHSLHGTHKFYVLCIACISSWTWTPFSGVNHNQCYHLYQLPANSTHDRASYRMFSPPQPHSHSVHSFSTADWCRQLSDISQCMPHYLFHIQKVTTVIFVHIHCYNMLMSKLSQINTSSSPIFWEWTHCSGEYKMTKYKAISTSVTCLPSVQQVTSSNLSYRTDYSKVSHGLSQSIQANTFKSTTSIPMWSCKKILNNKTDKM